ncbi:MAG: hypothetical protein PWP57_1294 [Candidatus Atribacteria bacterium]|nr:hypothetical protein [Candidatus Atribacteria bacterium]
MRKESTDSPYDYRYQILAAVMLCGIMGPIDASVVNVNYHIIGSHFGVALTSAQWIVMIYLLTISSLLPFYGRLGDIWGYKRVYLLGLFGFTITSLLCSVSYFLPSISWLILFRAIQGITAGMMMSVPYAIIVTSFPPEERGRALGINAISVSTGLAIGPSLGGFIAHLAGWPYIFLINIPIGIIGLWWGNKIIPELKGKPGTIDGGGAVTNCLFLFSFLFFLNRFSTQGINAITVFIAAVAVIAFLAFLTIEKRATPPLINLKLFHNLSFSLANLCALLNFMSQYILVTLTPSYFNRVLQYEQNEVGLLLTIFPLTTLVVAPFSGSLSDRISPRFLTSTGAALCALSLFSLSKLPVSIGTAGIAWRLALFGLGTGIFQSPNMNVAMGSVPREHLGVASSILATVRNIGMVLGTALGGGILNASVPTSILQGSGKLGGGEASIFMLGLKNAYFGGAILTGIAALISLFIVNRKIQPTLG